MNPIFFNFETDPAGPTYTTYLFAIASTQMVAQTFANTIIFPVQNPLLYGPLLTITKLQLSDGASQGELQYTITSAVTHFSEPRMATDPWGTSSDGLYIVSSVRSSGSSNGDFSNLFY